MGIEIDSPINVGHPFNSYKNNILYITGTKYLILIHSFVELGHFSSYIPSQGRKEANSNIKTNLVHNRQRPWADSIIINQRQRLQ